MRFVFMRRLSSIELNIDVLKKYSRYPLVTCYSIPISHKILCWNKNYNKQDALLLLIPTEHPPCSQHIASNAKRCRRDLVDLGLKSKRYPQVPTPTLDTRQSQLRVPCPFVFISLIFVSCGNQTRENILFGQAKNQSIQWCVLYSIYNSFGDHQQQLQRRRKSS